MLGTPRRYLSQVALVQAASWGCRIAVVMCLLGAFGLPASPAVAGVVMVVAGLSTVVPLTPGGAGTQQVLLAYALAGVASAGATVSFSIAMQAGITAVNALLGVAGAMVACQTLRPIAALGAPARASSCELVRPPPLGVSWRRRRTRHRTVWIRPSGLRRGGAQALGRGPDGGKESPHAIQPHARAQRGGASAPRRA